MTAEHHISPYVLLGISPEASIAEIKRAYRKMAKKYHPDFHPGDRIAEEMFKKVSDAYAFLIDRNGRGESFWRGAEEEAERKAQQAAKQKEARERAEREAAERKAKREAAEREAKERREREEREHRENMERQARREATEKAARERREKEEKEHQEDVEKKARQAASMKAARERAEHEAAEKAERERREWRARYAAELKSAAIVRGRRRAGVSVLGIAVALGLVAMLMSRTVQLHQYFLSHEVTSLQEKPVEMPWSSDNPVEADMVSMTGVVEEPDNGVFETQPYPSSTPSMVYGKGISRGDSGITGNDMSTESKEIQSTRTDTYEHGDDDISRHSEITMEKINLGEYLGAGRH